MPGSRFSAFARYAVFLGVSSVVLAFVSRFAGIVFNFTPSAPRGLYKGATIPPTKRLGYYILFCPDQRWPGFSNNPNYRRSYLANCPDGEEALLKPVAAWPGDVVTTAPTGVAVNGAILPNSMPDTKDPFGKELHPYAYGNYTVPAGQVWVISSYSLRSFDSRYFGPIPVAAIRSWVKPLIVEKREP